MNETNGPITFVVPGDLHLTEAGLHNHQTALWMVDELNRFVRPDFVQFIGDNVQNARDGEFQLFREVCSGLRCAYSALVGDHDVDGDLSAGAFRQLIGDTFGASSLRGFCFLRLNTVEHRPLGLSQDQITWFQEAVDAALDRREQVVVFQHHYPFKVCEQFCGPGVDAWRQIVQTRRIAAIFTGHTHYAQVANDGRNIVVATRSIGDPEGGQPGYMLAFAHGDDLAITYRSIDETGPIVLVTHPREKLLASYARHIIVGPDELRVRTWCDAQMSRIAARVDDGEWHALLALEEGSWWYPLATDQLAKGEHQLDVQAVDAEGRRGGQTIHFMVDATGRYTAVPFVRPVVTGTAFC